jgi:DNA-binding Xre family transcriptional regulator
MYLFGGICKNTQLAAIRKMWDQAQIAKTQLEEIIGIQNNNLDNR